MYSTSVYLFCFDSIVPSFGSFYEPYKCLTYMFRLHAENDKHSGSSFCFQPSNKILIKKEETGKQRQRQKKSIPKFDRRSQRSGSVNRATAKARERDRELIPSRLYFRIRIEFFQDGSPNDERNRGLV